METGTQVEVSQDMLDEADASDAYFDSQGQGTPRQVTSRPPSFGPRALLGVLC